VLAVLNPGAASGKTAPHSGAAEVTPGKNPVEGALTSEKTQEETETGR
jgi:hypothetical protein